MMNHPHRIAAAVSRIWVVMFDTIPRPASLDLPVASEQLPTEAVTFDAFDNLDARSDYFEQFVAQNVCKSGTEAERLGGAAALKATLQAIQKTGMIEGVRVAPEPMLADFAVVDASLLAVIRELGGCIRIITLSERPGEVSVTNPPESVHYASLVWFSVASQETDHQAAFRESALRQIVAWQQSFGENDRPILFVTGMKGIPKPLESPLESGLDENLIQLPLWIDRGLQHPRRIQSLVGSFDLLPTIADAFGCELPPHPEGTPEVSRPMSMLSANKRRFDSGMASDDPKAEPGEHLADRILTIHGDGWSALRAQQYLLVRRTASLDEETRESESVRQMFLKPDDSWNVNNMIVPFEAIADEMEARVS